MPSGCCEERKPVDLSMPMKRPEVTVCVMGSSLRQVTVSPTFTVIVEGLNISELRLITGPAGADGADVGWDGAVSAESALGLQPARLATAMSRAAAPRTSLCPTG